MREATLFLLTIDVRSRDAEALGGLLMELGAGAVEERSGSRRSTLAIYGRSRRELSALVRRARAALAGFAVPASAVRVESVPGFDWRAAFTAELRPQELTRRLRIEPLADPPRPLRRGVIVLTPSFAFGDGSHATTRLAARVVERLCLTHEGLRVLDVGSGSGVLSFVAAKSGAASVAGVEIDREALQSARDNARHNLLPCKVTFGVRRPPARDYDLVVANLEPRVLVAEAKRILAAARKARWLVLSGFLVSQERMVGEPFERAGFSIIARSREQGWCGLTLGHS